MTVAIAMPVVKVKAMIIATNIFFIDDPPVQRDIETTSC
jgi:hypothetical protein